MPYFPYRLSKYDKRRLLLINKNFDVETTFPLTPEQLQFINKTRIGKKISEVVTKNPPIFTDWFVRWLKFAVSI